MNEIKLTKDSDALLCVLYKEYLDRRKKGIPKAEAKFFFGSESIHEELMPKWALEDVDDTCRELDHAALLECFYGDDVVCQAQLTPEAIIYMENRFKDGLASLLGHLKSLMELVPWIPGIF